MNVRFLRFRWLRRRWCNIERNDFTFSIVFLYNSAQKRLQYFFVFDLHFTKKSCFSR
jgi:hypothetical protein